MGTVVLYGEPLSQPTRSVRIFLACANIPHEFKPILLEKHENTTPEFLKINPLGKVPCLVDGPVQLAESAAIMAYLCNSRSLPDHWYPRDPVARARVDSVMFWHGSMLRTGSMTLLAHRVLGEVLGITPVEEVASRFGVPRLGAALKDIETVFLAGDAEYVAGKDISIADLLLASEVEMDTLLDVADKSPNFDELMADRPKVRAWLKRVSEQCAPHYEELHAPLRKAREALLAKKAGQK